MTTAQTNQREFLNLYHFLKFTFEEIFVYLIYIIFRGRRDRMVVGFINTYAISAYHQ